MRKIVWDEKQRGGVRWTQRLAHGRGILYGAVSGSSSGTANHRDGIATGFTA